MPTGLRQTVLEIVNRVERKLGLNASSALTSTRKSRELLDMLNEVIEEISDAGDWQEMYREAVVSATSSVAEYEVAVSGLVKNVQEISWDGDTSPLNPVDPQDIRRFNRISNFGTPRHFAIVGVNVSSGNPNFRVHPVPTTAANFSVAYFQKPDLYTVSAASDTVSFPANLVFMGLYAKAMLHENGGEATGEYQATMAEYLRSRRESLNRYNADTGTDVYFVPTNSGRR